MKIRAIYLRAGVDIPPEIIGIEDRNNLDELYRLINCDTIDVTYRQFDEKIFAVVCDDNGKLKSNSITSAITMRTNQPIRTDLVGNLIVTGYPNDEGDFTSLSDEDIKIILRQVICLQMFVGEKPTDIYAFVL